MKITRISTITLHYPHGEPIQDATIPPPLPGDGGRAGLFVNIETDEGITGLGVGTPHPAIAVTIDKTLGPLLVGHDPFEIERLTPASWFARTR